MQKNEFLQQLANVSSVLLPEVRALLVENADQISDSDQQQILDRAQKTLEKVRGYSEQLNQNKAAILQEKRRFDRSVQEVTKAAEVSSMAQEKQSAENILNQI
jgi:hypothetical protein